MRVIFAGAAAAIATLALFGAAQHGTGQTKVASGSVRLVDQANDVPAPPPPGPQTPGAPPGVVLPPGMQWPAGAVLPQGSTVLPQGMPIPPLPPGVVLPPEVGEMWAELLKMPTSPPPNVPNEVCRYNTIRIPCPQ
jgi:hypothetical protein